MKNKPKEACDLEMTSKVIDRTLSNCISEGNMKEIVPSYEALPERILAKMS